MLPIFLPLFGRDTYRPTLTRISTNPNPGVGDDDVERTNLQIEC